MSHIPYRTGLPSIRLLLRKICSLINKFHHLFSDFMTPEQEQKFNDLYALCQDIIDIIDQLFASDT